MASSNRQGKRMPVEAGSSSSVAPPMKWEQPCTLPDINDRLFRQDWMWEEHKNASIGKRWKEKSKHVLSWFNNKSTESKLWKWKVSNTQNGVDNVLVCERVVDTEEMEKIGIAQRFRKLGWERALDWCKGATNRVYLKAVTEWMATLRFRISTESLGYGG